MQTTIDVNDVERLIEQAKTGNEGAEFFLDLAVQNLLRKEKLTWDPTA